MVGETAMVYGRCTLVRHRNINPPYVGPPGAVSAAGGTWLLFESVSDPAEALKLRELAAEDDEPVSA